MEFIEDYWWILVFIVGLLELILRVVPTAKNYSWIDKLYQLLTWLIPNHKKDIDA